MGNSFNCRPVITSKYPESTLKQWSPTPGAWVNSYWAEQKVDNSHFFHFTYQLIMNNVLLKNITGFSPPHLSLTHS